MLNIQNALIDVLFVVTVHCGPEFSKWAADCLDVASISCQTLWKRVEKRCVEIVSRRSDLIADYIILVVVSFSFAPPYNFSEVHYKMNSI